MGSGMPSSRATEKEKDWAEQMIKSWALGSAPQTLKN